MLSVSGNLSLTKTFNIAFFCYLGIQDVYGKYLINVPYVYSKTIIYAGAKIIYKHQSMKYKDVLEIRGPTNEALKVVVGSLMFFNEVILKSANQECNPVG